MRIAPASKCVEQTIELNKIKEDYRQQRGSSQSKSLILALGVSSKTTDLGLEVLQKK